MTKEILLQLIKSEKKNLDADLISILDPDAIIIIKSMIIRLHELFDDIEKFLD